MARNDPQNGVRRASGAGEVIPTTQQVERMETESETVIHETE